MEMIFTEIHNALHKLIGFHRELLEAVRAEHEALASADIKRVQDSTFAKQALIESIKQADSERMIKVSALAMALKKPLKDLTLPNIIIEAQGFDLKKAEQLRSSYNALTHLIKHITEQNDYNKALVEKSLMHVAEMKKNILGETVPKSTTYNNSGQRSGGMQGARLISKEA